MYIFKKYVLIDKKCERDYNVYINIYKKNKLYIYINVNQ